MAEHTLTLPKLKGRSNKREVKEQTYWGAVRSKLLRDKLSMAAIALGVFMVSITLAAPWIAANVLGFDPLDTNLRQRNAPPTWAEAAWPKFQEFSQMCQSGGCDWSLWPEMVADSAVGVRA
jgi:hypothetical protein